MSLSDTLLQDLKVALKARDEVGKLTLRMLKADLLKKEVDLGRDLTAEEELSIVVSAVKSRRDSITAYEDGDRKDLADAERAEIVVLERYLPKQLDEAAAREAIGALAKELGVTEKKQMGQLMGQVMAKYRGQIDGKLASQIARELLT